MAIAAGHAQTHRLACPIEAHQDAAGRTVEPRRIAIAAEMPPRTDRLAPGTAAAVLSRAAQAVPYRLPNEPAVLDQRTACRGVNLAGELIEGIACLRGREGPARTGHRNTHKIRRASGRERGG